MKEFFIPGSVPSSKNSKQVVYKNGRPIVLWSKAAQKYKRESTIYWKSLGKEFVAEIPNIHSNINEPIFPIQISFKFIRATKHKFDYTGPLETVQDLMTQFGWIPDDNADIMKPVLEDYEYNKDYPGVIIKIL